MSDDLIFREVDEDVRRERMEAVWKRYGGLALGIAVLIVAIVAGSVYWKDYQKTEREEQGARFEAALALVEQEQFAEGAAAFEQLAAEGNDGYEVLATIQAAAARAKAGEGEAALSAYDRMIETGLGTERQQDIIRMKAALLALEVEGSDAAIQRLGDLPDGNSVFRNAAREIRATALLASGDREGAISALRAIAEDETATAAQRDRVSRFLLSLGG
ncbi:tetratricopeptide repeat protein [Minwuia sp.]|uniref:tetratricopeptide repeat protein n=1 Tax=Minwuia sp. TaxID=2493630 RepID=UPI003A8F5D3E